MTALLLGCATPATPPARQASAECSPERTTPATTASVAPVATSGATVSASPWRPGERQRVAQLEALFETGRAPEDATFLQNRDPQGVPLMPRDPGSTGLGGEELLGRPLPMTRFIGQGGDVVDLSDWKGKKNVVLVILRGFSGAVCLSCTGQTLAISESLKEFAARDAEVFFVYPGPKESVPRFLDAVSDIRGSCESLPVELLLDVDLTVVREFKIEGKLANPTTIILDKAGLVRFAHVGRTNTDRPTVPAMLSVLSQLATKSQ
jgi:peroxiredoxin